MIAPGEPFLRRPRRRWIPPEMINPPRLDRLDPGAPIESRYALLVNPVKARLALSQYQTRTGSRLPGRPNWVIRRLR